MLQIVHREGRITWRCAFCTAVALALCVGLPHLALATPVGTNDAARAVRAWVRRGGALGARLGAEVTAVTVHATTNGLPFYSVQTVGGGTVFTAADDALDPILAFSSERADVSARDPKSPLYALLNRDIAVRMAARQAKSTAVQGPNLAAASPSAPNPRWTALLDEAARHEAKKAAGAKLLASASVASVGDLRVPPLVKSKWDQKTDGNGNPCYNYYVPNKYYCGCVATAMAQIMRAHEWPKASCAPVTKTCYVSGTALSKTSYGGVYDWDDMPLEPAGADRSAMTLEKRQAIGKLCYDAGVSVEMQWTSSGSGAYTALVGGALRDVFGYGSAYCSDGKHTMPDPDGIACKVLANLGAGYPVILGISYDKESNGHAIVGDGYGYNDGCLYVHLNMGWSGVSDLWYQLPQIGETSYYDFNSVDEIVYNIIPNGTDSMAVLSGRVAYPNGAPAPYASVAILRVDSDDPLTNMTANAYGVYGVLLPAGEIYEVRATLEDYSGVRKMTAALPAPVLSNLSYPGYFSTTKYVKDGAECGNAMDVDVILRGPPSGDPLVWSEPTTLAATQQVAFAHTFAASGGDPPYAWSTPQQYWRENGSSCSFYDTYGTAPYTWWDFYRGRLIELSLGFDFMFGDQVVDTVKISSYGDIHIGNDTLLADSWDANGTWLETRAQDVRVARTATSLTVGNKGCSFTLHADGRIVVAFHPDVVANDTRLCAFGQDQYFVNDCESGAMDDITFVRKGLPVGLSLDAASGALSGTPQNAGSSRFAVAVTDAYGQSLTNAFTLVVVEPGGLQDPPIADFDALNATFANVPDVTENIKTPADLLAFNAFLLDAGASSAASLTAAQKAHAYDSFVLSGVMVTPTLLEVEPELTIDDFAPEADASGGWSLTVSLSAGAADTAMVAAALVEMIRVGTPPEAVDNIPSLKTIPAESADTLTFAIDTGTNATFFTKVRITR